MRKILTIMTMAVVALCFSTPAKADSFTAGDIFLTGTVTGTTATLTIECTDATCNGWFLGDVTLKGFTFATFTGTDALSQAGYTAQIGGQNNNAVGNGGGCNGKDAGGAICWDANALPLALQLSTGVTYSFIADITGGAGGGNVSTLHVMATAYNNSSGGQTGGGKVFAISDDLLTTTVVPEPASLTMLGIGLLAIGSFARRRFVNC